MGGLARRLRRKIQIENPKIRRAEEENLWREAEKLAKLVPEAPEPNLGKVLEVKEALRKGTYLTSEMIEETAARIVLRFMRRE